MNHQQLLKHIVRVFPNWYVGMYISWVRPLWLSALQLYTVILRTETTIKAFYDFLVIMAVTT